MKSSILSYRSPALLLGAVLSTTLILGCDDGECSKPDGFVEGAAGDFGTLTLSGADTAEVGNTFTPIWNWGRGDWGLVVCSRDGSFPTADRIDVAIQTNNMGRDVEFVRFVRLALYADDDDRTFRWRETLNLPADEIDRESVVYPDLEGRSVTFNNLTLTVSEGKATAPITLNGTLTRPGGGAAGDRGSAGSGGSAGTGGSAGSGGTAGSGGEAGTNGGGNVAGTLTIGDQTWEFDRFVCAFGDRANFGEDTSFYGFAFGEDTDGTLVDLDVVIIDDSGEERLEGPGVEYAMNVYTLGNLEGWSSGPGQTVVRIDGQRVTAEFRFDDPTTLETEQEPGTLEATCTDTVR